MLRQIPTSWRYIDQRCFKCGKEADDKTWREWPSLFDRFYREDHMKLCDACFKETSKYIVRMTKDKKSRKLSYNIYEPGSKEYEEIINSVYYQEHTRYVNASSKDEAFNLGKTAIDRERRKDIRLNSLRKYTSYHLDKRLSQEEQNLLAFLNNLVNIDNCKRNCKCSRCKAEMKKGQKRAVMRYESRFGKQYVSWCYRCTTKLIKVINKIDKRAQKKMYRNASLF